MATAGNTLFDDSAPKDHMFIDELTCIGIGDFFLYRNKGFVSNFFR
jgi:hypothetical protein